MSRWLVRKATQTIGGGKGSRTTRRDFLGKTALVGTALAAAPLDYILKPMTAYAAITGCPPGSLCSSDGYHEL